MKNFALLLLALLLPLSGKAAFKTPEEVKFLLNQGYGSAVQLGTQLVDKKIHLARGQYDYDIVGGASGSHNLKDVDGKDLVLPDNAIIVDCLIDVLTAPTSGQFPQISIGSGQGSADLKALNVLGTYSGLVACVPVGSAATSIKLTAQRTPTITVSTTSTVASYSLIGGKLNVWLQYILSE